MNETSIVAEVPATYAAERGYVLRVLLEEFLGLSVRIVNGKDGITVLRTPNGGELAFPDHLFAVPRSRWLSPESLPARPSRSWQTHAVPWLSDRQGGAPSLPVIYGGDPEQVGFLQVGDSRIDLALDVPGSCFFLLSRYEEAVHTERDRHGRFPASASHAVEQGYLRRPLVNEYLEVLWACLEHLCPGLPRANRDMRVLPTHDVDAPLLWLRIGAAQVLRAAGSKALKWRRPDLAAADLSAWLRARTGKHDGDPYDTFDYLMDASEREGLRCAFYFQAGHTGSRFDAAYRLSTPFIKRLLSRIADRGHEIGLHPSYATYGAPALLAREFAALRDACRNLGIHQQQWGGRQHYLRWQTPDSFSAWDAAGLAYDSTLAYAEAPGFRSGTCYEHSTFDVRARRPLELRERPLVVMDRTLISPDYLGLTADRPQASELVQELKQQCARFNGDFTILWHNSAVVSDAEKTLYDFALGGAT